MSLFCKFNNIYLSTRATTKFYRHLNTSQSRWSENVDTESELQLKYLTNDEKGIAVIGLNRPKSMNAFSRLLVDKMLTTVEHLHHDKDVRVVIIRSLVPGAFCSGADLKERAKLTQPEVAKFVNRLRFLLTTIEQLPMPVLAAVDGTCLGGGLEMALACDIRTVADTALMGLVETKLAIIPGCGGTQRLPRILSPSLAKELIFTARTFKGTAAFEMGICNHSVPQNGTKDAAYLKTLELAKEILPNGPIGVRMAKKAIDNGMQVDLNTGYAIEEACYAQVIPTKDRLEGLKAFAEKRKPEYKGE